MRSRGTYLKIVCLLLVDILCIVAEQFEGKMANQENGSIQWENTDYDRTVMYRAVLEEYERAMKDKDYTKEQ